MIDSLSGVEADLLRLLRAPAGTTTDEPQSSNVDALVAEAERQGITVLLATRLADSSQSPLLERLRASARAHAAWEMVHRSALLDALSSLASAGLEPVLFKGTALAYSVYPNPVLRTRGDTDLIVPPHERERVIAALSRAGFVPETAVDSGQTSFVRVGPGAAHGLDVHWQVNDSEVLSGLFPYQELRAEAVPLPALAPDALAASPVHAMLLACMHRGAHRHHPYYVSDEPHFGGNRLIWLYDLHLLAQSFSEHDWQSFIARAEGKGLLGACAEGLVLARERFCTELPDHVWAALLRPRVREGASDYLNSGPWTQQWLDFRALPGARRKARYLRKLVFPSAAYMRSKYADAQGQWLPWLYARRAFAGTWRRLRRRES
jgi:hypothetical protein